MKFNWGTAIVIGFTAFSAFVFTLVARMVGSGNDLLSAKNYHSAAEINRDLNSIAASAGWKKGFFMQWEGSRQVLHLRFSSRPASGIVRLTCLSNAGADYRFRLHPLKTDSAGWHQSEFLPRPAPGNWLAEIRGEAESDSFLIREQFRIY